MHKIYKELLECPVCHGELAWDIKEETLDRIINAKVICEECKADYEVRDEIAMFLTPDLPRNDLWEQGESALVNYIDKNPEIRAALLDAPEEELNGADYWYKASYYEFKKEYEKSFEMFKKATPIIYTKEYIDAWDKQMNFLVKEGKKQNKPIVDIASGKCYLVEKFLRELDNYVVATDFSPTILMRNRDYYKSKGLYDKLSLIAFDARRTPFKNNSIDIMTSNLGIPNIENPGKLMKELYRICKGIFMPIMMFFNEDDSPNLDFMKEYGNDSYSTRNSSLKMFNSEPWKCEICSYHIANVKPTPVGEIIGGMIDGVPVNDTVAEFAVVMCEK